MCRAEGDRSRCGVSVSARHRERLAVSRLHYDAVLTPRNEPMRKRGLPMGRAHYRYRGQILTQRSSTHVPTRKPLISDSSGTQARHNKRANIPPWTFLDLRIPTGSVQLSPAEMSAVPLPARSHKFASVSLKRRWDDPCPNSLPRYTAREGCRCSWEAIVWLPVPCLRGHHDWPTANHS